MRLPDRHAVPAARLLLAAALLLGVAACDDGSGSDAADTSATGRSTATGGPTTSAGVPVDDDAGAVTRAEALCDSLLESQPEGAGVVSVLPTNAGQATVALGGAGMATAPWDGLPAELFVALCTFSSEPVTDGTPPTTVCPDGSVALDVRFEALYVDEDGRTSDAPLAADVAAPEAGPCAPLPEPMP